MVVETTGPASGLDQDRVDFRRTFVRCNPVDESRKIEIFCSFCWVLRVLSRVLVRKYLIPPSKVF